jgi:predicted dehydrogenase
MGVQGQKRLRCLQGAEVLTVDPAIEGADFQDVESVDPGLYDVAFICTPEKPKISLAKHFLREGKSVLVEKPLVLSEKDAQQLEEYGNTSDSTLYVAFNHRFEDSLLHLKNTIQSEQLGEPYLLKIFYGNGTAKLVKESPWRDYSGGVLMDIGSHLLDLAYFFIPETKYSHWNSYQSSKENLSADYGRLWTANQKCEIHLEATYLMWKNDFALDFIGSRGSAHVRGLPKWGISDLVIRKRPALTGPPKQFEVRFDAGDKTWKREHEFFFSLWRNKTPFSLDQQVKMSNVLRRATSMPHLSI